jgi:hypothetical protein
MSPKQNPFKSLEYKATGSRVLVKFDHIHNDYSMPISNLGEYPCCHQPGCSHHVLEIMDPVTLMGMSRQLFLDCWVSLFVPRPSPVEL